MDTAYVALGSNLGNREANLNAALNRISLLPGIKMIRRSSWIETDPVGGPPQGRFLNGVAKIEIASEVCQRIRQFRPKPGTGEQIPLDDLWSCAEKEAEELLAGLQHIEEELGRPREHHQADPRVIDLDLLDYGGIGMKTARLELPHPRMHERRFVLEPLAEIEPEWFHPVLAETAEMLLKKLK